MFENIANLKDAYRNQLAILSDDGDVAFGPTGCKSYIHDAIGFSDKVSDNEFFDEEDLKKPVAKANLVVAFWCSPDTRDKNAEKFLGVINSIEKTMKIAGRTKVHCPNVEKQEKKKGVVLSAPFIAVAPLIWRRYPVLTDFFVMLMRMSPKMYVGDTFDKFRERIIKGESNITDDVTYLQRAHMNGNLDAILNRTAPFFKRRGNTDYLLSTHGRGFADYSIEQDKNIPFTSGAIKKYLRKNG